MRPTTAQFRASLAALEAKAKENLAKAVAEARQKASRAPTMSQWLRQQTTTK